MSTQRGKKAPAPPGKRPVQQPRRSPSEVQPISPVGLVVSIVAALAIAAILLFVINTRLSVSGPASAPAAPTTGAAAARPTTASLTQVGSFSKGNANAKVTVTEYSDFK